ncbi:MAG: DUF4390 domain-containing protein [Syntrophales bacterium]|jgi:hypothetical protein|nr:DUF4390 domain-containing protein [Syntrophales bacterium]MDD5233337.1 DUF4390 domain-containing protein [Syntrophales bacterium]MDD5531553.1 DUF4390 domain-containing protein [Syntrophales bacterium]
MKSKSKRLLSVLIIAIGAVLVLQSPSHALIASISDLFVTHNNKEVLVYFRVKDCFTKSMEEAILAGIPTTFTFIVELYQKRTIWFDSRMASVEIKQTVKYDNVRNIFYVTSSLGNGAHQEYKDLAGVKRAMTDINGIAIAPLRFLSRENQYFVRVKAKLDKIRLPLHMEYVLFFVSMWDFETEWHRQEFVYK